MVGNMTEIHQKKLRDELAVLEHELAHDIPKELKKAVAMGDLSENAEYHMGQAAPGIPKGAHPSTWQRLADLSIDQHE